ncbi:MAG: PCMD domain-containing protein, partial [Muribaculaceae bacterium]|nr:PCMD domain-containing protein [Muribaculaceae bacterium]
TVTIDKRHLAISTPSKGLVEDTTMELDVESNGNGIDDVTIQSRNSAGTWDDLKVVSSELLSRSSDNTYHIKVSGLASDDRDIELRALVQKNDEILAEADQTLTIVRDPLPYTLIGDPRNVFSTYAILTIAALDEPAAQAASRAKLLLSTNDGTTYQEYSATVSGENLTVKGLTSGQKYVARVTVDGQRSSSATFTTETPFRLPNRDMEIWDKDPGQSQYWWIDYPYKKGTTAARWDTYNIVTTSQGGSGTTIMDHKGCSYVATSGTQPTGDSHTGRAAVIRTVGWGSSNGASAVGNNWSNACKYVSAGQLFLGDWSGVNPVYESNPNYGVPCQARPKSITFWYKYSNVNSADFGTAYIEVFDANGNAITKAQVEPLIAVPNYTKKTIELNYPLLSEKAAKIQVTFKSTGNPDALTPNSSWMTAPSFGNLSDGEYLGSSLYIDDMVLNY